MPRVYEPPEYNEAVMCPNCGDKSDVLCNLHGMIGGGEGRYTMCAECGCIVTKSFDDGYNPKEIEGEVVNAQITSDKA